MAIISRGSRDCDGHHNDGTIAFRDNWSAYRFAAYALGSELLSGNTLRSAEENSWFVDTEEGFTGLRIEYEREPNGLMTMVDGVEVPALDVDVTSSIVDENVRCDCPAGTICVGHSIPWSLRCL